MTRTQAQDWIARQGEKVAELIPFSHSITITGVLGLLFEMGVSAVFPKVALASWAQMIPQL